MTVIAWDGKTLVADKMASQGSLAHTRVTKITRLTNGDLVGYAGEVGLGVQFIHWLNSDRKAEEFPEAQRTSDDSIECIIIRPDGTIWVYDRSPYPYQIQERYYAIGSGSPFARAVMELGCDAVKAVKIATKLCPSCGLGYDKLSFKEKK